VKLVRRLGLAVLVVLAGAGAAAIFGRWGPVREPGPAVRASADECAVVAAATADPAYATGLTQLDERGRRRPPLSLYERWVKMPRLAREELRKDFPSLPKPELEALARESLAQTLSSSPYRMDCDWRALGSSLTPATGYRHSHRVARPIVAGDLALVFESHGRALAATGQACLYRRVDGRWQRQACGGGWIS
jgi:hypothetical protein